MTSEKRSKRIPLGREKVMIFRSLHFLVIILVLGSWSAGFYCLQETHIIIPEFFRYLSFFGGLVLSVIIGGMLGSILSRVIHSNNPIH